MAGERGDRRQGPGRKGEPLSAITAGCVSVVAMPIPGPVTAPDNRLPGRLPGVRGLAGYRRAAAGDGWLRRLRRASRDEGAWLRATRR